VVGCSGPLPLQANFPEPQLPVTQANFPVTESMLQSVRPQKRPDQVSGAVTVEVFPDFKIKPVVGRVTFVLVVSEAGHTA